MSQRKILIVDDEAPVRELLVHALAAPGTEVLGAESGAHALELAESAEFFDLVVTDIEMPGMNGIELARRLRRKKNARCFLFVSGYCDIESIDSALREFEKAEFLQKPFGIMDLLRIASSLCDCTPEAALIGPLPPEA
jgi:CheY-like chemotaxis protein